MTLLGVAGVKFSGKDTVGDYYVNNHGYIKLHYADPLKDILKTLFKFKDDQLNGNKKEVVDERINKTPREILQYVGTDLFRNQMEKIIPEIGKDFWLFVMKNAINEIREKNPEAKIIITDIRYPNESEFIRSLGGEVIKIKSINKTSNNNYSNHESEQCIDNIPYDYLIENDYSEENKEKDMKKLWNKLAELKIC